MYKRQAQAKIDVIFLGADECFDIALLSNSRVNKIYCLSSSTGRVDNNSKVLSLATLTELKEKLAMSSANYVLLIDERYVLTEDVLENALAAIVRAKAYSFNFEITKALLEHNSNAYFAVGTQYGWQPSAVGASLLEAHTVNALYETASFMLDLNKPNLNSYSLLELINKQVIDPHAICLCN